MFTKQMYPKGLHDRPYCPPLAKSPHTSWRVGSSCLKEKKKKSKNQRPTTAVQSYESKQKTDSILIAKQLKKLEGIPITAFWID